MSIFTIAISFLTTSNLPWFMDLTFQVPMQYRSLHHQTLLPSPVISTTRCYFCFGSISSFFLELFLHWSQVAYWAPTDLGSSSFIVLSFCLFILLMGFSIQEYWSGLPFPSPVDHVLSALSTMTCPSWVALHGMARSFHWVKEVFRSCTTKPSRKDFEHYFPSVWDECSCALQNKTQFPPQSVSPIRKLP